MAKKYYKENNENIPAIAFTDSAPAGFTEITDQDELKELYFKQYETREKDGHDFYNDFRTRLYMDILSGTITTAEAFAVELHLKTLKDELITGNWLTAQNISLGLELSGIYDQALKDDIQAGIDAYITENY
jgi:hypothetical protein